MCLLPLPRLQSNLAVLLGPQPLGPSPDYTFRPEAVTDGIPHLDTPKEQGGAEELGLSFRFPLLYESPGLLAPTPTASATQVPPEVGELTWQYKQT